jgi:hypothetical protein
MDRLLDAIKLHGKPLSAADFAAARRESAATLGVDLDAAEKIGVDLDAAEKKKKKKEEDDDDDDAANSGSGEGASDSKAEEEGKNAAGAAAGAGVVLDKDELESKHHVDTVRIPFDPTCIKKTAIPGTNASSLSSTTLLPRVSMLRIYAWVLSNLQRGKPAPPWSLVTTSIQLLSQARFLSRLFLSLLCEDDGYGWCIS